jgi:hypothetical protein
VWPERIMSVKNSNATIRNRTRDLPACSLVPQPTVPPHTPLSSVVSVLLEQTKCQCHLSEGCYLVMLYCIICWMLSLNPYFKDTTVCHTLDSLGVTQVTHQGYKHLDLTLFSWTVCDYISMACHIILLKQLPKYRAPIFNFYKLWLPQRHVFLVCRSSFYLSPKFPFLSSSYEKQSPPQPV